MEMLAKNGADLEIEDIHGDTAFGKPSHEDGRKGIDLGRGLRGRGPRGIRT